MKTFFFAIVGLVLLYSFGASAASPIERHVLMIKKNTNAAAVRTYLQGKKIKYKEIRDYNRVTRSFATWVTPAQRSSTLGYFGAANVGFEKDQLRSQTIFSRSTLAASNSSEFASLNQWGLLRVNGHTPDLYRKGGSAIADQQVRDATYRPSPTLDGVKGCVLDSGTAWDHPDLADRISAQFNAAYDPLAANTCDIGVDNDGNYDCVENIPPANLVEVFAAPNEDRNRYCYNVDFDETNPNSYAYVPCGYADAHYYDIDAIFGVDHGTATASLMFGENRNVKQARVDFQGVSPTSRGIVGKVGGWKFDYDYAWVPPENNPLAPRPGYYSYAIYTSDIVDGIGECVFQGAKVINISIGGQIGLEIERQAVAEAANNGVTIFASAGNQFNGVSGPILYPALYPQVISVAALGLDGQISSFSSRGSKIDFIAPGTAIMVATKDVVEGAGDLAYDNINYHEVREGCEVSGASVLCSGVFAFNGQAAKPYAVAPGGVDYAGSHRIATFEYFSGTSFSSPIAAGVFLRALSARPWLSADDLRASDLGLGVRNQGRGIPLVDMNIR